MGLRVRVLEAVWVPDGNDRKCPLCGAPLELRRPEKGQHHGRQFLVCTSSPRCPYSEAAAKQSGTSGRRGADLHPMAWAVPANLPARELFNLYQTRFFQTLALPKPLYDHVIVHLIMMCRRRDATSPIGRTNPSSSEAELADERSKSTISC